VYPVPIETISNRVCQHMKRVGNIASNRKYNASNSRPAVPFNTEEEDPARDRFIRQKYSEKVAAAPARQNNTGSTNSDDYPPPAVPPKPKAKTAGKFSFGMRSSSSIFPMSSKARAKQEAAAVRSDYNNEESQSPSSPRRNKASHMFGRDVATDTPGDLESKLAKLRDMGFRDERRNITVLKGLSGNLEKSIETLIRLEGGGGMIAKSGDSSGPSSRSRTPLSPSGGISFNQTPEKSPAKHSTNPFDMLDMAPPPAQPQSSQSTGSLAHPQTAGRNPYQQSNNSNPYGLVPSQSQYGLNQAFQNMSVSPTQPLFPNHTGGFPNPQQQQFQQLHQQSMTPPVPSISQQYYPPVIYEHPGQAPQQNYNPFMQQPHTSLANANSQSNPYLQQQQQQQQQPQPIQQASPMNTNFQSNPYLQQQGLMNHNITQSPVEERQTAFYDNGATQQQQQPQPQPQQQNPFFQNNTQQQFTQYQQGVPQTQAQQTPQQFRQQTHPQMQPTRADKHSILDLYNYPQLAPTPMQQVQQEQSQNVPQPPALDTQQPQNVNPGPLSAPPTGNRNPFTSSVVAPQSAGGIDSMGAMGQFRPQIQSRHISQESVDAGWQSGRHSPDAWGTISARSMR